MAKPARLSGATTEPRELNLTQLRGPRDCVGVILSDRGAANVWRFDFYAESEAGRCYVGSLTTTGAGQENARVIGWACFPGADDWIVEFVPLAPTPADAIATAQLVAGHAAVPGMFANGTFATISYL